MRQEFERDAPSQVRVFGFVDHSHAAAAQLADDFVVRESLINQRIHGGEPV